MQTQGIQSVQLNIMKWRYIISRQNQNHVDADFVSQLIKFQHISLA